MPAKKTTYGVIPQPTHAKVAVRNVDAVYGLSARAAAKAAVKMTRASKGTARAAIIPHGGSYPVAVCALVYRTRKGKTPRRGFVDCAMMPSFKTALTSKRRRR